MNLDELMSEAERLLSLLQDRRPGFVPWHTAMLHQLVVIGTMLQEHGVLDLKTDVPPVQEDTPVGTATSSTSSTGTATEADIARQTAAQLTCGCGKPVRYMVSPHLGSCNKHFRCPGPDEPSPEPDRRSSAGQAEADPRKTAAAAGSRTYPALPMVDVALGRLHRFVQERASKLPDAFKQDVEAIELWIERASGVLNATTTQDAFPRTHTAFRLGQRVRKTKGSRWQGRVVGWYSTALTPEGYAVESDTELGSVQIYPATALEAI